MKIRHEAPDKDLDRMVRAPLVLETPAGNIVKIERWSLAALSWPDGGPECPQTGTLSVPFQGVDIRFPVRLSARDMDGTVQFQGLSGRQRETLALFYRSLLSGRMASSAEVITSLDTPVDLVPMDETLTEQARHPVKFIPRPVRVAFNILTYLLVAAMVVGVVGHNVFTNLNRIDIQHGRVLAPTIEAFAKARGVVDHVDAKVGASVKAGDILLRLRETEAVALLKQTETELAIAKVAHASVLEGLEALEQQSGEDNPAMRLILASQLYSRFVGNSGFDDIRRQWVSFRQRDKALAEASDPLPVVRAILLAEVAERAAKVETLKARRDARAEDIDLNHVRAPQDGVVQDLGVQPGQAFNGQQTEMLFETADARVTIGWVSERFAETIFIGMPATIGFNNMGTRVTLNGVVANVRAGDHPERPGEFGIIVTVAATGLSPDETKSLLRPDAPVNLEAKRQLGTRLKAWILAKFGKVVGDEAGRDD